MRTFFVDCSSLAQAIADDYVVALLSDLLRCSVASVVTGHAAGADQISCIRQISVSLHSNLVHQDLL